MNSSPRLVVALSALAAAALLIAGCTSTPGADAPTNTDAPPSSAPEGDGDDFGDIEGALLDDGRMFAVVTWGSSTCVPTVDSVTADGQNVAVTLMDPDADDACTADLAPRASIGALPEGVDPTTEITLNVTYGDSVDDVELDGDATLAGIPGTSTEYSPSAGWFEDSSLVLLTWGSSTCLPIVESVEGSGGTGTVTFTTEDRVCTMDMAPRATILSFDDDTVEEEGFVLTLVGDNLDGTVSVIGD